MSKADLLVTFPLESLIKQLFGEDRKYYVPIETIIAQVIDYHIKTSKLELLYKIQYEAFQEISRFSSYKETKLAQPRLWIYKDWYESEQNYQRQKAHSIRDRENTEMLERNVKIVSKAYREFTGVDNAPLSEAKAYGLLRDNKMASIKMLGVDLTKLITTREQL